MAEKKIKIKMSPGHGISDTFSDFDDEIQPVMIEVWDGKRIAWAIIILSALILIPAIYLLYDSYWGNSRTNLANQNQQQSNVELNEPMMASAESMTSNPDGVVRLAVNDPVIKVEQSQRQNPVLGSEIEYERLAKIEQKKIAALVETHENRLKQQQINMPGSGQKATSVSGETITAEISRPQNTDQTILTVKERIEQQLKPDNKEQLSKKALNHTAVIPAKGPNSVDISQYLQSKHINRAKLVTYVVNREPVGENLETITVDQESETKLFYFTEVKGLGGQVITYRWLYGDQLMFAKSITVTGKYSWRSYTSKRIPPTMTGSWRVELIDSDGNLLTENNFIVK